MLRHFGISCSTIPMRRSPYDIVTAVGGLKIEVKRSNFIRGRWNFKASPQQLRESDFIVLALHGLAGRRGGQCLIATYVIVKTKDFSGITCLSIRQLLNQFATKIGNWRPIIDAERRRRESKCKAAR
jgi:hypothetical protein